VDDGTSLTTSSGSTFLHWLESLSFNGEDLRERWTSSTHYNRSWQKIPAKYPPFLQRLHRRFILTFNPHFSHRRPLQGVYTGGLEFSVRSRKHLSESVFSKIRHGRTYPSDREGSPSSGTHAYRRSKVHSGAGPGAWCSRLNGEAGGLWLGRTRRWRVWDVADGASCEADARRSVQVRSAAWCFSPDGRRVGPSGSYDKNGWRGVGMWQTGECEQTARRSFQVRSAGVVFSA